MLLFYVLLTACKHPPVTLAAVLSKVVVLLLLFVTPIVGFCYCFMFYCALICVHSSFVLMGKRELVALLCLSSWCLMIVGWLFLTMPWVCLQFVILVFPDHTQFFDFGCLWSVNVAFYVHMFYVHIHLFFRQSILP